MRLPPAERLPGVKEDVTNIILNLKQVRFKRIVEEYESEKVSIKVENTKEFKAGDFGKCLNGFEVLNPELVICHLDPKASMQIEMVLCVRFWKVLVSLMYWLSLRVLLTPTIW